MQKKMFSKIDGNKQQKNVHILYLLMCIVKDIHVTYLHIIICIYCCLNTVLNAAQMSFKYMLELENVLNPVTRL